MSSVPQTTPSQSEQEPLLGRRGDVLQEEGKPMIRNLVLGTGIVGQLGIWLLTAIICGAVFTHPLLPLVSPHPVLNSVGLLLIAQAALILQPTHTPTQKKEGTYAHASLAILGVACLTASLVVIQMNKEKNGLAHFKSAHSIMGFITYMLMYLQVLVGFLMYFVPQLFGSVARAKSLYKYHRASGYCIFTFALATVCAATGTTYNHNVLGIKLWTVVVASVLTLAGLFARVKKEKLGIKS